VPALDIVPLGAVPVEVVEDADARLVLPALPLLSVVWLVLLESACVGPEAIVALLGARDALTCGGPIPSIFNGWLKVGAITALKVALSSSCPDIVNVVFFNDAVDPSRFRLAVNAHAVHAKSPAVVPGTLPVPFFVRSSLQPRKVVGFTKPVCMDYSLLTSPCFRQSEYLGLSHAEQQGNHIHQGIHLARPVLPLCI